ncbi:MAG TPA: TonB-dependent receptor [Bryobacteraceae bacterium]|nr:TonB-dependent receptor [Bryobacteraceae bacterium]
MLQRVFTLLAASLALAAQSGTIQGVVKDPTDAVVAGATVTVVSIDTGLRRELTTNDQGFYTAPALPVGRYKISASKTGFSNAEVPEIKLDVTQTARIDFTLKTGTVTESIDVTAAAALIDSETTTVGQVIENKRIVELPLNGRNYLDLAALTAGTNPGRGGRTQDQGGFSAGGQHIYQVQVTVDGVDNSSVASGGPLGFEAQAVKPSVDAVGEFRVVTNNLSAEYGTRMGGQVFVNIKSGTNQFHGSAFEFLRNSSLDGTNFFANRAGNPKPTYKQNQFGGTFGGPIRRDKTFFFGSYEGTRTRLGRSFVSTVPVDEVRAGNFNRIRPVFDPATTVGTAASFTRQPFPGNTIPQSRWDPLASKLLALYPRANNGTGIANNYFFAPTEKNDVNSYDFKGDHNISDRQRFSARYSKRTRDRYEPGPLPLPADGGLATTTVVDSHSVAATHSATLGATATNEARFGFTRIISRFDIPYDTSLFAEYGIKGIPTVSNPGSNDHGLSRFTPAGYAELGSRSFWPNYNNMDLFQASDILYKNIGKHNIRFGGEFRRQNISRLAARFARGQFAFNREFTADPLNRAATGDGLAEFMLGMAANGTIGNENGEDLWANTLAMFVQNDWKISSRLTLNLGVRYDVFYAPSFVQNNVSRFVPDFANTGANARLQQVRVNAGDCGCKNDLNNFAPRVGFAWKLSDKTVIRSGAGVIYAQPDSLQVGARASNQAPDFVEVGFATLDRINPRLTLSGGFPAVQLPATSVPGPALVGIDISQEFLPTQYSQQWFFDVQRQLPFDTLLTVGYNGNGTRQLLSGVDFNLPVDIAPGPTPVASRRLWPFYTSVTRQLPVGRLSYNAMTVKVEKRFSKGLTFLSAYTWSKTLDNVDETLSNSGVGALKPWDRNLNRGRSATDLRQNYVVSASYELPFGKGKAFANTSRFADFVIGGWQLGGILTLQTGLPFTVNSGGGITNAGGADRPNRLADGNLPASQQSIDRWFDLAAFATQAQYTYGNSGRNILDGPGNKNLDLSLAKSFALTEKFRLQFRAESFNATNTANFGFPGANINAAGVGQITTAAEPRRVQFALKLLF